MKIFKLEFNNVDYDQYNAFIVIAHNKKEVVKIVKKKFGEGWCSWEQGYKIKEIEINKFKLPKILLGSYNAG